MRLLTAILIACIVIPISAKLPDRENGSVKDTIEYSGGLTMNVGKSNFAPFLMAANRYGILSSARNILLHGGLHKGMDREKRFSYGFGTKIYAGWSNGVEYERYSQKDAFWYMHKEKPSATWIEELYGEVKWRGVYARLGQKEKGSALLDNELSSGDMTLSANARPIAELSAGFIDFQDVPFTKGWLQVSGELSYGKFTDSKWWRNHADMYNSKVTSGIWYTYRRLYFRTNPEKRLSVVFGAQCAAQFGGSTDYYYRGELLRTDKRGIKFLDFFKIIFPSDAGDTEDFAMGNTLGSYDIRLNFLVDKDLMISAYLESPWEDGSGLAKKNGWDGLYGFELKNSRNNDLISGITIEYLDLTNQSGPIHWAPGDHPGTGITGEATGADDYYNNAYYNAWANYGMGMGNAMVMSPIYNRDGYMGFVGNRMRGVHVGAKGMIKPGMGWELKTAWRKAYGNGYTAMIPPAESWSFLLKYRWEPSHCRNISFNLSAALDHGKLPSNSFGVELGLIYRGNFSYGK